MAQTTLQIRSEFVTPPFPTRFGGESHNSRRRDNAVIRILRVLPMKVILLCLSLSFFCSCVSTKDGGRRFDPLEATIRADESIGKWLEDMDYPTERQVRNVP